MRRVIHYLISIVFLTAILYGCESVNSPISDTGIVTSNISEEQAHAGNTVYVDANNVAVGDGSQSNPFKTIQEGVDHASDGEVVELLSDFTLGSQVTISKPLTLEGNGNTIYASFAKTNNSNNSAIGIQNTNDVTISDLTIEGSDGTDLTGINVYLSTSVLVSNISINDNDHTGLLVNGSEVTAENISTSGHGWHGINVDQGGGVTQPAVLNISNTSSHDENSPATANEFVDGESIPDIFIDDATVDTDATVNDIDDQYVSFEVDFRGGVAKVYTHYNSLSKDNCKKGGYANYGFKNQGKCIQFVNTGKK